MANQFFARIINRTSGIRVRLQAAFHFFRSPWWLALGWPIGTIAVILCYLFNLGAGSIRNGEDAVNAIYAAKHYAKVLTLPDSFLSEYNFLNHPYLVTLGMAIRFLGQDEIVLRLISVFCAIGTGICLLTIAIDLGLGRRIGAFSAMIFLALPLTYELAHRVLPDMFITFIWSLGFALSCHALHGHQFDKRIFPFGNKGEPPVPIAIRERTLAIAGAAFLLVSLSHSYLAVVLFLSIFIDLVLSHRDLFKDRRVIVFLGWIFVCMVTSLLYFFFIKQGTLHILFSAGQYKQVFYSLVGNGFPGYRKILGVSFTISVGVGVILCLFYKQARVIPFWLIFCFFLGWGLGDFYRLRGLRFF